MSQNNARLAETENLHDRFLQSLSKTTARLNNPGSAENGTPAQASSGSALADFNAKTTQLRFAGQDVILQAATKAYDEDALLAVKLFFQTGDVRGGKGEREIFDACMDFLVAKHPAIAKEVLPLIPVYVRWDYLIRLVLSDNETISKEATKLVTEQFCDDLNSLKAMKAGEKAQISLLAKWLPSLQEKKPGDGLKLRHILKALPLSERDYEKGLSELREHLKVSEKQKTAANYSGYLKRVMAEKRHANVQAMLRGEAKMNDSILNPLAICHEYVKGNWKGQFEQNEDYEALWKMLLDKTGGSGNTMVIRDSSDSMTRRMSQDTSATMSEASMALAIYCSEKLNGPLKDHFITFSSNPQLVNLAECKSLAERLVLVDKYEDCSSTDVTASFDLILEAAKKQGLKQDALPSYLMILSDMEFDVARGAGRQMDDEDPASSRKVLFENIRKKWQEAGYQAPTLVFWKLNATKTNLPEVNSENGAIYLSGYSTEVLNAVMAGEFDKLGEIVAKEAGDEKNDAQPATLSPKEALMAKLSSERYDDVAEALRGILNK